mmetsp:Transcript_36146/g.85737  ORF Transcript_36146/g.85737 Transcript_36146/m.85737 type:complete len:206 (+) Transcript_36146:531-1148(+)
MSSSTFLVVLVLGTSALAVLLFWRPTYFKGNLRAQLPQPTDAAARARRSRRRGLCETPQGLGQPAPQGRPGIDPRHLEEQWPTLPSTADEPRVASPAPRQTPAGIEVRGRLPHTPCTHPFPPRTSCRCLGGSRPCQDSSPRTGSVAACGNPPATGGARRSSRRGPRPERRSRGPPRGCRAPPGTTPSAGNPPDPCARLGALARPP